jgi:hypothetical protein
LVGEIERYQEEYIDVDGMMTLKWILKNKHFCTEDGGRRFLQNVHKYLPVYKASHPQKTQ